MNTDCLRGNHTWLPADTAAPGAKSAFSCRACGARGETCEKCRGDGCTLCGGEGIVECPTTRTPRPKRGGSES